MFAKVHEGPATRVATMRDQELQRRPGSPACAIRSHFALFSPESRVLMSPSHLLVTQTEPETGVFVLTRSMGANLRLKSITSH